MTFLALSSSPQAGESRLQWQSSFDLEGQIDRAAASALVPGGSLIAVSGATRSVGGRADFLTVMFSASDGSIVWSRTAGSEGRADRATSVAVTPDGQTTAVTGLSRRRNGERIWRTIAYATTNGARLWQARFSTPRGRMWAPQAVLVSDEHVIAVGNVSVDFRAAIPAVAVAYDRSDGSETWSKTMRPDRYPTAQPGAIVHSSSFDVVHNAAYLGIQVDETVSQNSMGVLALAADDGSKLWRSWFMAPTGEMGAHPVAMALSPDGSTVSIGGTFDCCTLGFIVAFFASDGSLAWSTDIPDDASQSALESLAVSPDGTRLFGAGHHLQQTETLTHLPLTLSLSAETGELGWERTHTFQEPALLDAGAPLVAVASDGSAVYLTAGRSEVITEPEFQLGDPDIETLAYEAESGALMWSEIAGDPELPEHAVSIVEASGNVVVCGTAVHIDSRADYTCFAYAP